MAGDVSKSGGSTGEPDQRRPGLPDAPLALYRRYRPATFAEVKGQEHVTEPLRQALRSGRVHHAYLFSGPRGCGKTSSARILARSLNCEQGPTPDPCGECASCVALAPTGPGSIDVIEIDAASHGGIDDARDLRERAFYSPVSARYKIYIIDEAHMVTGAGFNALLKLVEEPPPHLKFVFATTEPEKVIPTIRSRTHHYPFRLVPPAILRELLEEILAAEGIGYEPAVLPVVIRAGAGSVRDSLSILDQLIAGADEAGLRYDRAIALLGYTDDALLDEMAEAFAARDGAAVFLAIDHVVEAGHDPRRFAMDLLDRLRDLIILAAVPDAASSGLLDVPEDQLERMRKQADGFGQERLARAAETISVGLVEMRGATSPRLLLELMCAQVLLPAGPTVTAVAEGDLAARLDRLERQVAEGGSAAGVGAAGRAVVPAAEGRSAAQTRGQGSAGGRAPSGDRARGTAGTSPADGAETAGGRTQGARPGPSSRSIRATSGENAEHPVGADAAAGGALTTSALRDRWPEVLGTVRDIRRTAWILLSNFASIADVEGNVLTMAFDSEGNAKGFASSGSDGYLADVIQSMFGVRPVIRAIVQPGAGRGGGRPGQGGRDDSPASAGPGDHDDGSAGGRNAGRTVRAGRQPAQGTAQTEASDNRELAGGPRPATPSRSASQARPSRAASGSGGGSDGNADGDAPGSATPANGTARQDEAAQKDMVVRNGTSSPARRSAGGAPANERAGIVGDVPVPGRGSDTGAAAARAALADAAGRAGGGPRQRNARDQADDPRLHTDTEPRGQDGELTGSDLIMRELGGQVIGDSTEV